jgi:nanoRNase/pAp phosphatase (c-di-AMP/oligoRNAs hydrolase)
LKIKLIAKKIKESKKIVLFHHIMADGDSISCSYGLLKSLKSKFPKKIIK